MRPQRRLPGRDRKSTRLNSSHVAISYAVFCLKKKRCDDGDERSQRFVLYPYLSLDGSMVSGDMMLSSSRLRDRGESATTAIDTLSLHDALPISRWRPSSSATPARTP